MPTETTLAVHNEVETKVIINAYRDLLRSINVKRKRKDTELIRKAYEIAVVGHQEQRRKSGEPYILHPIAVAKICAEEIGLGVTSVIAALLHDTIEDTNVKGADIERDFGSRIRKIVEGLTKFDNLFDVESPQAENFRKVLSTLADDPRVVLIKMADRMHNMRTIGSMPHHKQIKIASETSYIYSPLAHRLGLYNLKTEFEDRCMKIMEVDHYAVIEKELERTKDDRDKFIKSFINPVKKTLSQYPELKGRFKVYGRIKAISSIWNKMKKKQIQIEDIYDIFAVRIVLDVLEEEERQMCWRVYSILTDMYTPIPDRLKDWTREPKSNGYQSLHTTVIVPYKKIIETGAKKTRGRYVEVQIRSDRMNDIAEKGLAAHWKYKGNATEKVFDRWLSGVREILENPAEDAIDFLNEFKSHLFTEEVYVFTPKGEMKILPKGATALDFAFSVHTEVGSRCTSVKVGNQLVPMSYELRNADHIEVITNKSQKPSEGWLKYVKTTKAKTRIRVALREEKRQRAEFGKELLIRKLKGVKATFDDYNLDFLVKYFKLQNRTDLYFAIDKENINIQKELKKFAVEAGKLIEYKELIFDEMATRVIPEKTINKKGAIPKLLISGEDASQYVYDLATCCSPVQGDNIFAYTTGVGIIKIHRVNCPNATNLLANYGYRVMSAEWVITNNTDFIVDLKIIGIDGIGVVQKLTHVITNVLRINMRSIKMEGGEGFFTGEVSVVVANTDQLHLLMKTLKEIENVSSVLRME
ncbi:MAG: GTP pyrophosphokinase [Saprospiraceae bacterium]|jgi:GTP pyrophosphokinase